MKLNSAPFVLVTLFVAMPMAHAQTLTTAETMGKGKKAIFFSSNVLNARDFATLGYSYAQVVYGLTDRADLYVGPGFITVFDRTQGSMGIGANTNILKSKVVSISTYNLVSLPLNSRRDGATLLFSSQVISRTFKISRYSFSGYTGWSFLAPLGRNRAEKLFTPPHTFHFVPLGLMLPLGKRVAVFAEYNHGNPLRTKSFGVGISP